MPLRNITEFPDLQLPIPVAVTGTNFGNELQNKILNRVGVTNLLMFYLCTLATLRWMFQGN